jgi:ABC-type multidrug transport system fused ATPase/permease subunit
MLKSVMKAKIRFFDLNPIGRIMNRFSKDIGSLDDVLPITLFDFLQVIIIFKKYYNHNNIRFKVHFCCNWEYYIRRIRKLLDHFTLNSNDNPIYIH